ncbi:MAG TPA: phosphoribosylglycinamide synthetase C domain-containing protein, partial [Nitrospira sp.]|nr:phosphoribosylglycinamide synthetase C domain-containing protein [Nitrospira sp.]
FNARMGDPETQVVLPLLKTDLIDVVEAVVEHRLDQLRVEWYDDHAVCVVLTSGGYPGTYQNGYPISGLDAHEPATAIVFHAGTVKKNGKIVTAGGRVLGITGRGNTLTEARAQAYQTVKSISFDGCHYRKDIASRALNR